MAKFTKSPRYPHNRLQLTAMPNTAFHKEIVKAIEHYNSNFAKMFADIPFVRLPRKVDGDSYKVWCAQAGDVTMMVIEDAYEYDADGNLYKCMKAKVTCW